MRPALLLLFFAPWQPVMAQADPVPAAPVAASEPDVVRLNRAISDHNDAIRVEGERADAAYRAERARYEASLAENVRVRAEAEAARQAFLAASRQHEADLVNWRATLPGKARRAAMQAAPAPASLPLATGKPVSVSSTSAQYALDAQASRRAKAVCSTGTDTGSLVKKTRTCGSRESWKRRIDGEQEVARELVKQGGDNLIPQ